MKRDEVTLLHQPGAREAIRKAAQAAVPTRGFEERLRASSRDDGTLGVIAEIKRRSPSKGDLAPDLDASETAVAYERGGATCLSVLTDRVFFGGAVADLQDARDAAAHTPVLRKDFTIDPDQVYETRGMGADAILLIVAAVPDDTLLRELHVLATELGLSVLVEVHDDAELDRALQIQPSLVGINARNLGTFAEDLAVGEHLVARLPADVLAVAESAIRSVDDARAWPRRASMPCSSVRRSCDPTTGALVHDLAAVTTRERS